MGAGTDGDAGVAVVPDVGVVDAPGRVRQVDHRGVPEVVDEQRLLVGVADVDVAAPHPEARRAALPDDAVADGDGRARPTGVLDDDGVEVGQHDLELEVAEVEVLTAPDLEGRPEGHPGEEARQAGADGVDQLQSPRADGDHRPRDPAAARGAGRPAEHRVLHVGDAQRLGVLEEHALAVGEAVGAGQHVERAAEAAERHPLDRHIGRRHGHGGAGRPARELHRLEAERALLAGAAVDEHRLGDGRGGVGEGRGGDARVESDRVGARVGVGGGDGGGERPGAGPARHRHDEHLGHRRRRLGRGDESQDDAGEADRCEQSGAHGTKGPRRPRSFVRGDYDTSGRFRYVRISGRPPRRAWPATPRPSCALLIVGADRGRSVRT